jgi:hypothetical protein
MSIPEIVRTAAHWGAYRSAALPYFPHARIKDEGGGPADTNPREVDVTGIQEIVLLGAARARVVYFCRPNGRLRERNAWRSNLAAERALARSSQG